MKTKTFVISLFTFLLCGIAHADLTTGLVAYYPFNGNANDESGNGNNGTVYGATLTTDRFGNKNSAYNFDGAFDYIKMQIPASGGSFSISYWINFEFQPSREWILTLGVPYSEGGFHFLLNKNGVTQFGFYNSGQNSFDMTSNKVWTHIVTIYDQHASTISTYINSAFTKADTASGSISNSDLYIGKPQGGWSGESYYKGIFDDLRIYNRVLSESEIKQLYNEGTNKSPSISSFTATPKFGNPPLTVNFNVAANDPDGSIASYQWDFHGDGGIDDTTATGKISHIYNDLGTFKASVTVVDNQGAQQKSSEIPITVQYGPDLIGEVESYRFDKFMNMIRIYFNIKNVGAISAPQFPVTFNLSNNGQKVVSTFKTVTVDKLGAGESQVINVDYSFKESIYGKYILILVDPTKKVAEVDETNNGTMIVIKPMITK